MLAHPPRHLFFTGKGGVGKTSVACAVALALAGAGRTVLLVSTDPASNLGEMLGVALSDRPTPVPGAAGLSAMNIDPDAAADAYRGRVMVQMSDATSRERETVREQLSGACTTEVAAFDEFSGLLAADEAGYDHVIFDTAPTGHTLRLLSLPKAWTGFLAENDQGASCLGPHSGLKIREERFNKALAVLSDARETEIVLVTRPERSALAEAARTSDELRSLGLLNQRLVVNGVFHATRVDDPVAKSLEKSGQQALAAMPESLRQLPTDTIPLHPFDMLGLPALKALFEAEPGGAPAGDDHASTVSLPEGVSGLGRLVDDLAAQGKGLIMVMGKGGVGKTTVAAAVAVGLVQRGHDVHLSTTDPAAHLSMTVAGDLPGLRVDRIDPKAETERYVEKIMAARGAHLDEEGRAMLREDLRSPCTEEVAVFHAFSRIVAEARSAFVVLDTAPTGHTLLLLDATGAYHRQMTRDLIAAPGTHASGKIVTPLMRLRDPAYTRVIVVTLPETTPVSEAAALQEDLRRAQIEPYAWVINRSLLAVGTHDPLLRMRLAGEAKQVDRIRKGLSRKVFVIPWLAGVPTGVPALMQLAAPDDEVRKDRYENRPALPERQ
ncbi:arsenical pump-driving ATPase [Methylobacterium sp. P31]